MGDFLYILNYENLYKQSYCLHILTDTWFFCSELLQNINQFKKNGVHLVCMAKMNNAKYMLLETNKEYPISALLKMKESRKKFSKKFNAHYICIPVNLNGIRINLFLVKMGRNSNWRLLVTNDLTLNFTKIMNVYKLRWSIEVFFKEAKQFLNLEGCNSSDFDGHIAHSSLVLIQYI